MRYEAGELMSSWSQADHQRPPRRREFSSRTSMIASAAPKMIHGAITIRSLPVI